MGYLHYSYDSPVDELLCSNCNTLSHTCSLYTLTPKHPDFLVARPVVYPSFSGAGFSLSPLINSCFTFLIYSPHFSVYALSNKLVPEIRVRTSELRAELYATANPI